MTTMTTVLSEASDPEELRVLIAALASCPPDVWPAKKRALYVQTVQDVLTENADCRKLLSNWQGMLCRRLWMGEERVERKL
jgi:hypothetical protein